MIDRIQTLIQALRQELQEYGEMLALLDRQQEMVMHRAAQEVFQTISLIQSQSATIQAARARRESLRRSLAEDSRLPGDSTFNVLTPALPAEYRPLVSALVEENNALLIRVQQRARQNHLLLSRSVEFMQNFMNTLFPARETLVYNGRGNAESHALTLRPFYQGVG